MRSLCGDACSSRSEPSVFQSAHHVLVASWSRRQLQLLVRLSQRGNVGWAVYRRRANFATNTSTCAVRHGIRMEVQTRRVSVGGRAFISRMTFDSRVTGIEWCQSEFDYDRDDCESYAY